MSFDVLRRDLFLNQHILCEASAGTGKTFTIEHLFIRRLISAPRRRVSDIAVLTFTKAVASELTLRLKRALDRAIHDLRTKNEKAVDYLLAIIEEQKADEVAALLELARDEIEFASIDTIHGFCFRCLSENFSGSFAQAKDINHFIEEFFRTSLDLDIEELKVLLGAHGKNFSALSEALAKSLWDDSQTEVLDPKKAIQNIAWEYTPDEVYEALCDATLGYNKIRNRNGEIKKDIEKAFRAFSKLGTYNSFSENIKYPLFASQVFSAPKQGMIEPPIVTFAKQIEPLLYELAHKDALFKRIKISCRAYVSRELERCGLYAYQELLHRMEKELEKPDYVAYLQKRYSCLIVDEFQDTDPIQWKIIQKLSGDGWKGVLYLVGDPKQAIYSFRQADVYCYMQAKSLENQAVVTLTRNFRSSPDLVTALNTLFIGPHTASLFPMPRLGKSLDVPKIECGSTIENLVSPDRAAIHFFTALEEEALFSFIANEIVHLGVFLSQIAILVKDRFQSDRLVGYLEARGVSTCPWRTSSIIDSKAHLFLKKLTSSLNATKDRKKLIDLVMQEPFSYSSASCVRMSEDLDFWAEHVRVLNSLRRSFEQAGLAGLIHTFLHTIWPGYSHTMKEALWTDKEFILDLEGLIAECPANSVEELEERLYSLSRAPQHEKDEKQSLYDPGRVAVQVLTIHASKGLEFDVVFALGLAGASPKDIQEEQEVNAERLRLFYVACTRAKRRLYLPALVGEKRAVSPMDLFLDVVDIDWLVEASRKTITKSHLASPIHVAKRKAQEIVTAPRLFTAYPYCPNVYTLQSFSSRKQAAFYQPVEVENSLPAGTEGGLLLHELLHEKVALDLEAVKNRLEATAYEGFEEEVLLLLQRASNVNFGSFRLGDVDSKKRLSEARFVYREGDNTCMHGYIDLLFEHNGAFYLVDWKSNALESYSEEALQQEVARQGYSEQARIYMRALETSNRPFGGFYFVFLRGLTDDTTAGVHRYV